MLRCRDLGAVGRSCRGLRRVSEVIQILWEVLVVRERLRVYRGFHGFFFQFQRLWEVCGRFRSVQKVQNVGKSLSRVKL
jgi:hypothetical protein